MLDFMIDTDVGIIEYFINSYQNLAVDKLKSDFLSFTGKIQKKRL